MSHRNQMHHQRSKSCNPSTSSTWRSRSTPSPRPTDHSPAASSSRTETPSTTSINKNDPKEPPSRRKPRPNLHRLASLQWSSPFTQTLSPDPRDPYTERSYLMQNLQSQDLRAKRLLARLSSAEERLALAEVERTVPGEARRIRKEISLLKAKMVENSHQERLTLLRLSDLYVEIQGRERWTALQRQKAMQGFVASVPQYYYCQVQAPPPPPPPPPTAVSGSFPAAAVEQFDTGRLASLAEAESNSSDAAPTPGFAASLLSPLSPDFVPGSPFAENIFWARGTTAEKDDDGAVDGRDVEGRRPQTPTGSSARSSSVPGSVLAMPFRERRSSVPPPRFTWSDEDAEEPDVPVGGKGEM